MTSASRRRSSSTTRRRSSSDTSRDSSQASTRARQGSQSSRDRSDSTDTVSSDFSTHARQDSLSSRRSIDSTDTVSSDFSTRARQDSLSSRRSIDSTDVSTRDQQPSTAPSKEPVGKTKRSAITQSPPVKSVREETNPYLKGTANLVDIWKEKTSSTIASNRGKNQPILLEIDKLLGEYEEIGRPDSGSNSTPHLDILGEIQAKLDALLKNPGSRQAAALELQTFVKSEIEAITSNQSNDYLKDDVNLLDTWKQKTALSRTKRADNLKEIDQLLDEYQKLGEPYWGDPKAHIEKLTAIDQKLTSLLRNSKISRQMAAVAEELQAFVQTAMQELSQQKSHEDDAWDPQRVAGVMTGGVKKTLDEQNQANALIWYHTLFSPGKSGLLGGYNEREEAILKDQQELLKRYFFSLAFLGVLGGDQEKPETYQPLETFVNKKEEQVGLATVASGGGLFNFRSSDGSGDAFQDFLYGASTEKDYLGAYLRPATHGNEFTKDGTLEKNVKRGESGWTGINIPIGGVGQRLTTSTGTEVVTGYQGKSTDGKKDYQTGAVLFKHYQQDENGNTLMGFEGSAPHADNIHGGSHGVTATISKKFLGGASDKTLTGQGKRTKWGVAKDGVTVAGEGGRIAQVSQDKLNKLEKQWGEFQKKSLEQQQEFFKQLLLTTTQQERDKLLNDLLQDEVPPPLPPWNEPKDETPTPLEDGTQDEMPQPPEDDLQDEALPLPPPEEESDRDRYRRIIGNLNTDRQPRGDDDYTEEVETAYSLRQYNITYINDVLAQMEEQGATRDDLLNYLQDFVEMSRDYAETYLADHY